jgi:hypothetical protein
VRPSVDTGESTLSESTGPTGKRSAVKVARSVWNGGKAVKPYLSLPITEMPGYLRPHVQTILPGPKDPKYTSERDSSGRHGSYWVEFTFQPSPILQSSLEEEELRSGFIGDSHLVISDPLPEGVNRKHVFTVNESKKDVEYFIHCNKQGRLSHVNFKSNADNFDQVLMLARRNFEPFLSGWSARFNVPLYVFRIRILEESSNIVRNILFYQLYPIVHISQEDMNRGYRVPEDTRVLDFYREALNSTSPKYQFLCYFKVVELVLSLRAERDLMARQQGKKVNRVRDLLLEEKWFLEHLSDDLKPTILGKKFTTLKDSVLRPIRNKIAHALVEDDDGTQLKDDEIFPYLPVAKLMAERLLAAETIEQLTGTCSG